MKFWKKIFSYSVAIFVILLTLAGIIIVEKTFEDNLKEAILSTIAKYNDVENNLYLNADYLLDVDFSDQDAVKNWITIITRGYVLNTRSETFHLEFYTEDNTLIVSDWERHIEGDRPELECTKQDSRNFLIRRVDGKRYVFISSLIKIKNSNWKLVLSSDIESVYQARRNDYEFFSLVNLGISILLAGVMYLIAIRLTRPIHSLSESAKEIAKGNYGSRVREYGGTDEIEVLKHNFNKMAEVIEENISELQYHNEAKQRFVDSLNHEIKTPITSIIGYSDLLLRSKVEEPVREQALRYINSEARRLAHLNSVLLNLTIARTEEIKQEMLALCDSVESAIAVLKYKLEKKQITCSLYIEEVVVQADRLQLEILLVNLLDNAYKASKEGQLITITGRPEEKEGGYQLVIQDKGIGMEKEDLEKIREPFYMADKARTRKENGLGLGLAICNEICIRNQITMSFESAVGEGTSVTLQFDKEKIVR